MTDRELLYVTTIAQEGSLTRASQKLHITQPALSHSLTGIEQTLGQPLFRRESRGLTLTLAGERYCETAREILRMYGDLEQSLGEIGELRRGRVLAGITRFLSTELMPQVFPAFRTRYPNVELRLWEESSARLLEMVSTRQLDFVVMNLTEDELEQMQTDFTCRVLYRDPFVIAAAKGDAIGALAEDGGAGELPVLDPRHLAAKPLAAVAPGQRIRLVTERVLRQAGIAPEIMFTSASFETARRVACASGGMTLLPQRYTRLFSDGSDADYYAIPAQYHASLFASAVRPRDAYLSAAAARFLDILYEAVREDQSA